MWGALISAGASLLGGAMARDSQESANNQNYAAQKEFAQSGLQWKAADARAAGLHPMAVLGSQGASFSPSFQASPQNPIDLTGMFDDMDSMGASGQDTTRAQRAVMTDEQREMQAAQIRNQQLQNALLEGQLAEQWGKIMGQPSNPPGPGSSAGRPTPRSGQANTGEVRVTPSESEATRRNDAGAAAGASPMFREQKVSNQTSWDLLNPDVGESFEAYGEVLKPFLAGAAHGRRLMDRNRAAGKPSLFDKLKSDAKSRFPRKRSGGASSAW